MLKDFIYASEDLVVLGMWVLLLLCKEWLNAIYLLQRVIECYLFMERMIECCFLPTKSYLNFQNRVKSDFCLCKWSFQQWGFNSRIEWSLLLIPERVENFTIKIGFDWRLCYVEERIIWDNILGSS